MERIISVEERQRRAEEIYYKRKSKNNNSIPINSEKIKYNDEKVKFSLYKKLIIKILICILIYLIFTLIKDANYFFSSNVINKTNEILSKDINFLELKVKTTNFWKENQDKFSYIINMFFKNEKENVDNKNKSNITENSIKKENDENKSKQEEQKKTTENLGIGGSTLNEEIKLEENKSNEKNNKKTQMEIDVEYLKKNFEFILPVKGPITSRYGKRKPTKIVSENHQGIDIGVVEGTEIVSAIDGEVSLVSKQGEYGTHIKIVNKDVTTIYAHCSKILVKEGEKIKKGEKIALSGNTGKTTGPHLHFEIRREKRTVNPELILSWK